MIHACVLKWTRFAFARRELNEATLHLIHRQRGVALFQVTLTWAFQIDFIHIRNQRLTNCMEFSSSVIRIPEKKLQNKNYEPIIAGKSYNIFEKSKSHMLQPNSSKVSIFATWLKWDVYTRISNPKSGQECKCVNIFSTMCVYMYVYMNTSV